MKYCKYFFILLSVLIVSACSKSEPGGTEPVLPPKPADKIELPADADLYPVASTDGDTLAVSFNASTAWSAQAVNDRADAWCSVYPTSGSAGAAKISIATKPNTSPDERSASIIIKAGTATQTIKVTQKQKDALLVTASAFEVPAEGGDVNVEVKANVNVSYKIDPQCEGWIKYVGTKALKTSTLAFAVSKNEDLAKREGRIIIGEGALCDTVMVFQAGEAPSIVLNKDEYTVKAEGETFAIEVASNMDVNVEILHPDGSPIWLHEHRSRTMSTNTYYFTAETNREYVNREARIVFTGKENGVSDTVKIVQIAVPYVKLSTDEILIEETGGEFMVEADSNFDYTVKNEGDDWISGIDKDFRESNKHYFCVSSNESDTSRVARLIFISSVDENISDTLVVIQKPYSSIFVYDKNIELSSNQTNFGIRAEVSFTADLRTKIIQQGKWLKDSNKPDTKSRGGLFRYFEAEENTSELTRYAKIVFYDANNGAFTDTVEVTQFARNQEIEKNFEVLQKEFIVPLEGCRIALPIKHSGNYYIEETDYNVMFRIRDVIYEGETDYVFFQIGESELERESKIVVWDKTHSISDTVVVKQQESPERLHGDMGQIPQGIICSVHCTGGVFSFKIFTNLSDYKIVQVPSKDGYKAVHLGREKEDYGYLEIFEVPKNPGNIPQTINLAFIGDNVTFMLGIRIVNKLTIQFDNTSDIIVPHSGGLFSTNVWANDHNLNVRIEGDDTGWLSLVNKEQESREGFARIISTFEASPNTTGSQREAYIVAFNGFGEKEQVRVVQTCNGSILLSESFNYIGSWKQTIDVQLIDCDYKAEVKSGKGWVMIGQSEKRNGEIVQCLEIEANAADQERRATIAFTSDSIVNTITLVQLPESDALVDNSPEQWKSFQLPEVNFKTPYPASMGTMLYNAIVKDPVLLIEVESRKVLNQLYFSPDEPLIPRRDEIEYKLDNYDGISGFYSGGNGSGIVLSNQYVESYYKAFGVKKLVDENRGVLAHELTHSFQLRPKGVGDYSNPVFHACIEGMADAVRVLNGYFTDADRPKGGSYMNSYRYTGFFIAWLVKNKDKDFLRKFNMSTQYLDVWSFDGAIKYALGQNFNVDDLWNEYLKAMGDI